MRWIKMPPPTLLKATKDVQVFYNNPPTFIMFFYRSLLYINIQTGNQITCKYYSTGKERKTNSSAGFYSVKHHVVLWMRSHCTLLYKMKCYSFSLLAAIWLTNVHLRLKRGNTESKNQHVQAHICVLWQFIYSLIWSQSEYTGQCDGEQMSKKGRMQGGQVAPAIELNRTPGVSKLNARSCLWEIALDIHYPALSKCPLLSGVGCRGAIP